MRVTVVGGGVVGLCAAEALRRSGAEVVLLEAGACGGGASEGNAGWIVPGLSGPLPAPGTVARALRWMVGRDAPLRVHPSLRLSLLRWCYDFWRSTTVRRYHAGMAALVALNDRTLAAYDALADRGVSFERHTRGILFVARSKAALAAELADLRAQADLGYRGDVRVLNREEALETEPELNPHIAGAVLAADEQHVRPESLTSALTKHLRSVGVEIREHTHVQRLTHVGQEWHLECDGRDRDVVRADRIVVAAGIASARLLAPLGVQLPLEAAKGYSITRAEPSVRLARPVYMLEAKIAASPFRRGLRIAGTLELGARDLRLDAGRLRALERATQNYLRGWDVSERRDCWAGFRSLVPDGLPVIGPVPGHTGLFVATGHGMLGVTLAPATAEVLAPAVLNGGISLELAPFSPARFGGGGAANSREPASRGGRRSQAREVDSDASAPGGFANEERWPANRRWDRISRRVSRNE